MTVIPLRGYSNWGQVEPFTWLCKSLLPDAIRTFVILDRDYRSDEVRRGVIERFTEAGIKGYVWQRKELESYLVNPTVIARVSGAPEESIAKWLKSWSKQMENDVFSRLLDERFRERKSATKHQVNVSAEFKPVFDKAWKSTPYRLETCPPKQLIAKLNDKLQAKGYKAVSMSALARAHRKSEVPAEVVQVLSEIEATLAA